MQPLSPQVWGKQVEEVRIIKTWKLRGWSWGLGPRPLRRWPRLAGASVPEASFTCQRNYKLDSAIDTGRIC